MWQMGFVPVSGIFLSPAFTLSIMQYERARRTPAGLATLRPLPPAWQSLRSGTCRLVQANPARDSNPDHMWNLTSGQHEKTRNHKRCLSKERALVNPACQGPAGGAVAEVLDSHVASCSSSPGPGYVCSHAQNLTRERRRDCAVSVPGARGDLSPSTCALCKALRVNQ